jgi:ubiquitin-protein ligase
MVNAEMLALILIVEELIALEKLSVNSLVQMVNSFTITRPADLLVLHLWEQFPNMESTYVIIHAQPHNYYTGMDHVKALVLHHSYPLLKPVINTVTSIARLLNSLTGTEAVSTLAHHHYSP